MVCAADDAFVHKCNLGGIKAANLEIYSGSKLELEKMIQENLNIRQRLELVFFNEDYRYVSAILGSTAGLNQVLMREQEEYVIAHNHKAKNPIKRGLLKNCAEYKATLLEEDKFCIKKV